MTYKLILENKHTYLHATVTGLNNKENVVRYLEEVFMKCLETNSFNVLIEERLEGPRLNTLDVFSISSEGSNRVRGKLHAVAYVDVNAKGELMHFAETVAVNRALLVKVFATVTEAEEWLLSLD